MFQLLVFRVGRIPAEACRKQHTRLRPASVCRMQVARIWAGVQGKDRWKWPGGPAQRGGPRLWRGLGRGGLPRLAGGIRKPLPPVALMARVAAFSASAFCAGIVPDSDFAGFSGSVTV